MKCHFVNPSRATCKQLEQKSIEQLLIIIAILFLIFLNYLRWSWVIWGQVRWSKVRYENLLVPSQALKPGLHLNFIFMILRGYLGLSKLDQFRSDSGWNRPSLPFSLGKPSMGFKNSKCCNQFMPGNISAGEVNLIRCLSWLFYATTHFWECVHSWLR